MATCDAFASLAAAAGSLPSSYSTAACGALARMYFKGEEGNQAGRIHGVPPFRWVTASPPGGSTCAEPPPERTPTSACDPISAMDFTRAASSGNWLPSFFSSTMDSSAICCASSSPWKGSTTLRTGGLSITPQANMLRRIRCTISLRRAEETVARHLLIESVQCRLGGRVRAAPVRKDPALEAPLLLQHLVQQVVVFAGIIAVDLVVRAHHARGLRDFQGDLERQQIGLPHGPLVEDHIQDIAPGFLVVECVVLNVAHHLLGLQAFHS